MRFAFDVGDAEKSRIEFCRDPVFGRMTITANGQLVGSKDPAQLSTHFDFEWLKRYTFVVEEKEQHEITIEHERPRWLGGLRRHKYRVFVDGRRTDEEHYGF